MKKGILIGLCIVLFLAVSCTTNDSTRADLVDVDYRSGSGGLTLSFLDNLPPEQTFEGADFVIAAKIQNEGAYEARNPELQLIGFDSLFFTMEDKFRKVESLDGRELTNPTGEQIIEEFRGTNERIPLAKTEFNFPFIAQLSYDYETIASLDVCVDTNIYTDLTINQQSCKAEKTFSLSGQGAPVAVTSIEQSILPGKDSATLTYIITIANQGEGNVVGPVRMKEVRLANKRLVCRNREVDLDKKTTQGPIFVCSTTQQIDTNFLSKLSVSLVYRYQISQKKQFIIKRFKI